MFQHAAAVADYLAGVDLLKKAVAGMSDEQLRARPVEGKWSTLEVVCHLADFEPVLAERMKRIIAMPKPILWGADENDFARTFSYGERDVKEEIALIEATRRQMAKILSALPEASWQREGVHNEKGLVTLEKIVATATRHIPHHVKFIEEKRNALRK
jgi:uncharacterized damage-inducible protein DinB